jgi:hypothetical protein
MAAPNLTLTTLDEVKDMLNFSDDTHNDRLEAEILAVSQAIEDYCNRTFMERTLSSEKIDGDGTIELRLRYPIIEISSISNDGVSVVETTNYEQYARTGLVILTDGTIWANGHKKITITYRYGYAYDDLPRSIRSAANLWVMKRFSDIRENRVGVINVNRGDESLTYEKGMPTEVKRLVDGYKIIIGGWSD